MYIYDLSDTWNNGATTYSAIKMNVTDSASDAASRLLDLQRNGTEYFWIRKDGRVFIHNTDGGTEASIITSSGRFLFADDGDPAVGIGIATDGVLLNSSAVLGWSNNSNPYTSIAGGAIGSDVDLGDAGALAMRFTTNLGASNNPAFRIYETFSDASNYSRVHLSYSGSEFAITTQAAGTGTRRGIKLDSANRSAYIASPTTTQIRDIFISFGLMAAS